MNFLHRQYFTCHAAPPSVSVVPYNLREGDSIYRPGSKDFPRKETMLSWKLAKS